jgi:uncharacterized protein (TIGR02145 family)
MWGEEEPPWVCGASFTDIKDWNIYTTVKIGDQCWMAENLRYLPGETMPEGCYVYGYEGTSVAAAKNYEYGDEKTYSKYGVLYSWTVAQNVCPTGWHLPTDIDWQTLEMELGMSKETAELTGWRGTDEGAKLSSFTKNGTNSSGFTALMAGYRDTNGTFRYIGSYAYFWSSSPDGSSDAWRRGLYAGDSTVNRYTYDKARGFSVRCLRD